jgi:predicted dehydrogenase
VGNGHDGYQAARVIDAIYESYKSGRVVALENQP